MSDDSNVPRRLRRFLRKGQEIPEHLLPEREPGQEPWMNPGVTAQAKSNIAIEQKRAAAAATSSATAPRHKGRRFQDLKENASAATPIDHALGLGKKNELQEQLPQSGNKAIQMKKDEIQQALDEIKKFHASTTTESSSHVEQMIDHITEQSQSKSKPAEKLASFHFTPVASAPNAVEPEKLNEPSSSNASSASAMPIPDRQKLTPRERMELRRQQRGQPAPAPATQQPASSAAPSSMSPAERSHIRRRSGQVAGAQAAEAPMSDETPSENMEPEAIDEFKDLFGESKSKKKAKKSVNEDEELDSDDDLSLFEDEK